MRRTATPDEQRALSTTALALASLAYTWTPGIAAIPAAVLTYLAVVTLGAIGLRWTVAQTLAGTSLHLRLVAATTLRTLALIVQATATALLWLLNTATTAIAPKPADYAVAA
jgi:hypothetical protein